MPQTIEQRITKADAFMDQRIATVQSMQANYRAANGRYFQGIATHDIPPGDEANVPPNLDRKPTDQPHTWRDVGAAPLFPPGMEASAEVHVYDGPNGQGYVIIARMTDDGVGGDGRVWRRQRNFGPETWRELAWAPEVVGGI